MTRNEKETNVAVRNHIANCLNYVSDQLDGGGCKEEPSSNNTNQERDLE